MFGLMNTKDCSRSSEQKKIHRYHYCGTCKTIGYLYGQRARVSLNSDVVFLAELLSAISGENQPLADWDSSYHSFNCLALPMSREKIPLSLLYSATANLLLVELKIDDHIADTGFYGWKIGQKVLSKSFQKAAAQLIQWRFPIERVWEWARIQRDREAQIANAKYHFSSDEAIDYLAEPTATMTALTFLCGAKVVKAERSTETLRQLGYFFGKIAYILDAIEDFQEDFKRNSFNALRSTYQISDEVLSRAILQKVVQKLEKLQTEFEETINLLQIPAEQHRAVVEHLSRSLVGRIRSYSLPHKDKYYASPSTKKSFAEKWRFAVQFAKQSINEQFDRQLTSSLKLQILTSLLTVTFFLFPHDQHAERVLAGNNCENCEYCCCGLIIFSLINHCCCGGMACDTGDGGGRYTKGWKPGRRPYRPPHAPDDSWPFGG